ncbi:MAG: hypothetical protein IJC91_01505 [Oscillospiraceae bacterium]|nr:hypothetical protein [Oscillospiraceae bacterium]
MKNWFFKKYCVIAAIIIALLLCSCETTVNNKADEAAYAENIDVSFNTEGISYIVFSDGGGPLELYYDDHKEIFDNAFEMIIGEYHYIGNGTIAGFSGGGPDAIAFFDEDGNNLYTFRYLNNCCAVYYNDQDYCLYEKDTGNLELKAFEDYCRTMRAALGTYEALYTHEFHIWSTKLVNSFESIDAPKALDVEFDGNTYSGEYAYSVFLGFDTYRTDYYDMEHGWFEVNSANNKITAMVFTNIPDGGNITAEECEDEALRIANQFIDVSTYEMTVKTDKFFHSFSFEMKIAGLNTCARCYILFSKSGELVEFNLSMTEEMETLLDSGNIKAAERNVKWLTSEGAEYVLANKIRISNPSMDEYEIIDKTVVLLEDGEVAVAYTVDITESDVEEDTGYVMESSQRKNIVVKYITK